MKRFIVFVLLIPFAAAQDLASGRRQFATRCAGCHGADGAGGEHGPDIVDTIRVDTSRRQGDRLRETIRDGISEGGMPAFALNTAEMNAIVAFVTALRAPAADHPTTGDVAAGGRFFSGKGNCAGCHATLGPDLTNLARDRRLAKIERALRRPETLDTPGFHPVTVTLTDGRTLTGVAKNESGYDLQMQDLNGRLHLLPKDRIAKQVREPKSVMPSVDATPEEYRDLLAFLTHPHSADRVQPPTPSTGAPAFAEILHPKPGDWPTYNGDIRANRHSELAEIDTANVSHLAPTWMFPIPNAKRLEGTPLVVDGVMYVTTANEAFALDARRGRQIWHYSRPLTKGVIGDAASVINRGVALLGDRLFMVTDDARMIALNRFTGQLIWDTAMADYKQHYGGTSAPLVVGGLVLSGTSGGDEGARGFLDAYRTDTGERAWRFRTMPVRGGPGSETWIGRAIDHGCVTAWFTGAYDPETDLIYWTTGNPCPDYNGDERKGDNLYSSSVVALEPKTGKLRWYYQFTPHDLHDWDATQPTLLVNAEFRGRPRKLLLQGNRNGFFYVLDRVTGEFLLGEPFVKRLTWASGIGADGRPKPEPGAEPTPGGTKVCPAVEGATNWFSSAFSPATGLFYLMARESCNIYTKSDAWWEPGKSFYGGGARLAPDEKPERYLRAIDIQTGKVAWEVPQVDGGRGWGGVLSTAGGLVFFCDDSGAFAAADAKSGKVLWHFNTNQRWNASPMTYAVDGHQYVAVEAGSVVIAFGLP